MDKIYGIDLGSTYSCIAVIDEHGIPVVLKNFEGERTTPSVVLFEGDQIVVGREAKASAVLDPNSVVELVKRQMGDPNAEFEFHGTTYRPEEVSAFILRKIAADAAREIGEEVKDVVITCPAWFGVNQRDATAKAGEIAGLNVRKIINEPTAAAISYGMDAERNEVVLVYDLGGGTFDVTMIEVADKEIRVICTGGDHELGGKDWDAAVVEFFAHEFSQRTGTATEELLDDPETLQDLHAKAEQAKQQVSVRDSAKHRITHGGQRETVELTRERFDELTSGLLERTIQLTKDMLQEAAKRGFATFSKILLVGGSTRMRQVESRLTAEFHVPCELHDPDESVAKGAAKFAWKLSVDAEIKIRIATEMDSNPEDIRLDAVDPAMRERVQDEVAASHGLPPKAVRNASNTNITNVTSKTFGIAIVDRTDGRQRISNLIKRNDRVPAERTERFGTVVPDQRNVSLQLMESTALDDVIELDSATNIGEGELLLPAGLPEDSPIDVTFRLNDQGRLEVEAVEPGSKEVLQFSVDTEGAMTDGELADAKRRCLATRMA